ncbi:MAG: aminotransferase class V-fold PLP-dependent enzyme, partial [Bryobacteraceae bacterium]
VRGQFPFTEDRVPMNAANLCPSPAVVTGRVAELTRDIDIDCSFQNREKFSRLLEESRAGVARQLNVTADEIAIVRNTSEANNIINNGLPLKQGDEVVVWDQNHPTNNVAWDVRAARFGIAIKRVSTPAAPKRAEELADAFERAFTPKTKVLAITHVSNVSGVRLPVRQLSERARRRGLYIHVDGAQTWGALDVDLRDLACDSYSASAHKWLLGPREVGLLYVRKERIAEIWPNTVAPGWGSDIQPDVAGARKFESLGQRDDARLAALKTAVDFHAVIGSDRVEARVLELAAALKDRIAALDLPLATPRDPALSGGVCILRAEAKNGNQAFEELYQKHGIAGAATGGLRLCPHIYNTMDHIERAAAAIKSVRHLLV